VAVIVKWGIIVIEVLMIVYLIKNNTNGKCYVGQTTSNSPSRRWSSHCRLRKSATNQTPISLAIQKYGKHNFSFMVLATAATQQELDTLERHYISEFNCQLPNGYNLTSGGSGGFKFNDAVLQKMSNAKIGSEISDSTRDVMSKAHIERWKSKELRDRKSKTSKALWQDKKYSEKISKARSQYWSSVLNRKAASRRAQKNNTEEHKQLIGSKVKEALSKPEVRQKMSDFYKKRQRKIIDDMGVMYESVKQAAEMNAVFASSVVKQLKGEYRSISNGRSFRYVDCLSDVKPTVYMVCGVSGVGKSWVCRQLTNMFNYVSYDEVPKKEHLRCIIENNTGKHSLYDPSINISTFIKRNSHQFDIRPIFIIEDEATIRSRLSQRGGTFTESAINRMRAIDARTKKYGIFSGNSLQVLEYLIGIYEKQKLA